MAEIILVTETKCKQSVYNDCVFFAIVHGQI